MLEMLAGKFPHVWTDVMKASWLQRYIIIHSILYYDLDTNVITDRQYDRMSKDLVAIMSEMPEDQLKQTDYYYCMYDYDGNTGFDIRDRLTKQDHSYLTRIAMNIRR